ncbi:contractile injection system tape measure protein [Flavobacterium ajazii]|uniref:contractile injection system tape measure protein n=1 Tax=Flavobacterium ajazii TaxID=2692318 RepID=UPI0013CFA648|nr:contractile injection system tape measure protein [Flavobacterium ajazii]
MEEINRHIVSSLKWDTTFDQKEEGYKLQDRLSTWSKISLPGEAANIFNELCPPEQSWRIESLELDLGTCDYDDLEFDLSIKIRNQLKEKIAEMIIYQNNQKKNLISVYNKEKSILENLIVFLMEGYLPWNYQNKEGSINEIMAELLQNNLGEVITVIKKAGITHEQVRKRLAWQFNESNITKIIAALEPNNSHTIVEFTSVMTKLQVKETIIQTSALNFKKNLWFFIFNFLLLERGTLFNKLAFMKSSILQMANHYNISYAELILLIENTIDKLSDKTSQDNNFIASLKTLTQEFESQKKEYYKPEKSADYWTIFEQLLQNKANRKSQTDKNNLNELIVALSNENIYKFNTIVNRSLNNENILIALIQDLNETSLSILFSNLDTTSSLLNLDTIICLNKLGSTLKLKTNSKILWEIGIVFLLKNKTANHNTFLLHCIKELSKKNNLDPEQLLESFTSARIPSAIKNNNSEIIYNSLNTIYCNEIELKNSNYPAIHFKNLLLKLETQLQKTSSKNELFIDLQRSLIKNITLHPKMAFEVMLSYGNKDLLKKILPLVLNRELLELLVKTANYKKTKLVETIQVVYEILNAKEKYNFPEELLTDDLLLLGIQEILLHPEHNSSLFLETIIIQLSKKVTNTKRKNYFQFIMKLLQSKKIKSFGVAVKNTFLDQLKNNNSIDILELALLIQSTSQQAQSELSHLLILNFDDSKFVLLRKKDEKESLAIMHYFLKNGIALKNSWVIEHSSILAKKLKKHSKGQITSELNELFWITVLKYPSYKGNEILFQKMLEKALENYIKTNIENNKNPLINHIKHLHKKDLKARFLPSFIEIPKEEYEEDITEDDRIDNDIIQDKKAKNKPLLPQRKLSEKEQVEWFSLIICQKQIPLGFGIPGTIDIKELLDEIILKHPKIFFRIIKKEFIAEAQMDWLCRSIDFNSLCKAVSELDKNKESYLNILKKFHYALGTLTIKGIASKEIQVLLLRKLLKAAANDNWKIISIDKIWNELIWEIVTKKGIDKKSFLMDIEKHIYQFPLSLQLSFKQLINSEKQTIQALKNIEMIEKIETIKMNKSVKTPIKEGIPVRNAGIVLLNSYIVMLFERLNLVRDNEFTSTENQIRAAQYLQYVVTGLTTTEEAYLPLNKVLCGLSMMHAIPDEIEISTAEKTLINGLITAAISYWAVIGDCSVDGFRGNWLVRDGILTELEDRWELTVDKRAYDILISKSPFAFSIIKYPWMDKPLHVNWPY